MRLRCTLLPRRKVFRIAEIAQYIKRLERSTDTSRLHSMPTIAVGTLLSFQFFVHSELEDIFSTSDSSVLLNLKNYAPVVTLLERQEDAPDSRDDTVCRGCAHNSCKQPSSFWHAASLSLCDKLFLQSLKSYYALLLLFSESLEGPAQFGDGTAQHYKLRTLATPYIQHRPFHCSLKSAKSLATTPPKKGSDPHPTVQAYPLTLDHSSSSSPPCPCALLRRPQFSSFCMIWWRRSCKFSCRHSLVPSGAQGPWQAAGPSILHLRLWHVSLQSSPCRWVRQDSHEGDDGWYVRSDPANSSCSGARWDRDPRAAGRSSCRTYLHD